MGTAGQAGEGHRTPDTESVHTGLITALVSTLREKYRVEADHLSVTFASLVNRPQLIESPGEKRWGNHRPDIVAWHHRDDALLRETLYKEKVRPIMIEVETEDSLDLASTADQLCLFSWYAENNGFDFYLAVPPGNRAVAGELIERLQINAGVWEP